MGRPQKILFVITQFYRGGAETSLVNLFRRLDPACFETELLVMNQLELRKADSLLGDVPPYVTVHNPAARWPNLFNIGLEVLSRVKRKLTGKPPRGRGTRSLLGKQYDWAVSYGEWVDPGVVARDVQAKHKAVWVHTDIDKSLFFDADAFFAYDAAYDKYLFVSEESMRGAVGHWPVLRGKAQVVHNSIDREAILKNAGQPLPAGVSAHFAGPLLVSVGNLRREKNYPRQVEAMALLRQQGILFTWLVVGSDVDVALAAKLRAEISRVGLEDCFLLLGADRNPYKYMAKADAVCVLGDYESWSLVITEALALGVPVIATRTSGALQQLREGENGLLTDFSAEAIAAAIGCFLADTDLRKKLREGAKQQGTQNTGPAEFEKLVAGDG